MQRLSKHKLWSQMALSSLISYFCIHASLCSAHDTTPALFTTSEYTPPAIRTSADLWGILRYCQWIQFPDKQIQRFDVGVYRFIPSDSEMLFLSEHIEQPADFTSIQLVLQEDDQTGNLIILDESDAILAVFPPLQSDITHERVGNLYRDSDIDSTSVENRDSLSIVQLQLLPSTGLELRSQTTLSSKNAPQSIHQSRCSDVPWCVSHQISIAKTSEATSIAPDLQDNLLSGAGTNAVSVVSIPQLDDSLYSLYYVRTHVAAQQLTPANTSIQEELTATQHQAQTIMSAEDLNQGVNIRGQSVRLVVTGDVSIKKPPQLKRLTPLPVAHAPIDIPSQPNTFLTSPNSSFNVPTNLIHQLNPSHNKEFL